MKVASSIVIGKHPTADLAALAVAQAMKKADITIANSVLLLLTSEFAGAPQATIRAAAKTANCIKIMGCSATGIFTEDDWVIDAPAAAAMVFGDDVVLQLPSPYSQSQPIFTLSAPNAINSTWLNNGNIRYGGVSGDAIGHGPFSVWQNAKGDVTGYVEAVFKGAKVATKASHGLQLLTPPQRIEQVQGYDILALDKQKPLNSLQQSWKMHSKSDEPVPLHMVMAVYADEPESIANGNYYQTNLISHDDDNDSVTLARTLKPGTYLSWGLRNPLIAEADLTLVTHQLLHELGSKADFGLLFSCLGRGPYFYGGVDRDLKVLTAQLPSVPLIGFYGNGEIASIAGSNQLLPYSAVLSLFSSATI
ncbi:MAG: FIST C-terminal domain-containing protein [Methylotenera sp.]|nr:FIST C-terminal domain-containing protein [Methylotenera sp.]